MLDRLLIRRTSTPTGNAKLDLGLLAEAMLFYNHVYVLAEYAALDELIQQAGPEAILDALGTGHLTIEYFNGSTGISTTPDRFGIEQHSPILFSAPSLQLEEVLPKIIEKHARKPRKRLAKNLIDRIKPSQYEKTIVQSAHSDFSDQAFLNDAVSVVIKHLAPTYQIPSPLQFTLHPTGGGRFTIRTNIDFNRLSGEHQKSPNRSLSQITPAHILSEIAGLQIDAHYAAQHRAGIQTTDTAAALLKSKLYGISAKLEQQQSTTSLFQEYTLDNAHALREAINTGAKSFDDFLKLLEKAEKFRAWIHEKEDDTNLLKEYTLAISQGSWLEALPIKLTKFIFFAAVSVGTGLALNPIPGAALGVGLSALDSLVLDALLKKWRPNAFIQDLKGFTGKN